MITRLSATKAAAYIVAAGSVAAALLLLVAPSLPAWGERHTPHASGKTLPLPSGRTVEQTFTFEHRTLDTVVIWLDTAVALPEVGALELEITGPTATQASNVAFENIPPSGIAVISVEPPITANTDQTGALKLRLTEPNQRVELKYQIDATKYPGGQLIYHPNLKKEGDLAFQLRYRRPALGSFHYFYPIALALAAGIILAGARTSFQTRKNNHKRPHGTQMSAPNNYSPQRRHLTLTLLIGFAVALFYFVLLSPPGTWIGPSDFSKELSYVTASAEAVRHGSWPVWSHYTCGGMALLGNPEGTTLSLSTLIALAAQPERALWITLALEAGLAAAGAFVVARLLKISTPSSLFAALTYSLSSVFAYKIVEGIVMVGGAVALTPWLLAVLVKAQRTIELHWSLVGGLLLAAIFWRGDVHIIVGIIAILVIWTVITAIRQHSMKPVVPLLVIGSVAFIGASLKVLPFLEQPDLIGQNVDPHSAQLTKLGLWDDIFLKVHDRDNKIPVLHGLPEHYGYFGAYTGIIPILLAVSGLLVRHRYRWHLLAALLMTLALVEGSLYETTLRHLGPLSALLRMPTRLLTIAVLLIALLAGIGLDRAARIVRRSFSGPLKRYAESSNPKLRAAAKHMPIALSTLLIVCVAADLARATSHILNTNVTARSQTTLATPAQPMLAPHLNTSPRNEQHASVLLANGYLLPHVCGDQNNPPEFLTNIAEPTPISSKPATIAPNLITLHDTAGTQDVTVRSRFVSSWSPTSGTALAADNQSIHVITTATSPNQIELRYLSASLRAQQALLAVIVISILMLIYCGILYFKRIASL